VFLPVNVVGQTKFVTSKVSISALLIVALSVTVKSSASTQPLTVTFQLNEVGQVTPVILAFVISASAIVALPVTCKSFVLVVLPTSRFSCIFALSFITGSKYTSPRLTSTLLRSNLCNHAINSWNLYGSIATVHSCLYGWLTTKGSIPR